MSNSIFIHPTAVIDKHVTIGEHSKVWHFCHIMSNVLIGKNCSFGQNVFIGEGVTIGNKVKVQNNVSLYSGLQIEDHVFIGPSAVFTNVKNPRSDINRQGEYLPTKIAKGATIGANATIICGNIIGRYAFIGAGTVVTKDIPDFALVVGNPAKQIGWMSKAGHQLKFNTQGYATCPEHNTQYRLENNQVNEIHE